MATPQQLQAAQDRVTTAQMESSEAQSELAGVRESLSRANPGVDIDRKYAATLQPATTRAKLALRNLNDACEALRRINGS